MRYIRSFLPLLLGLHLMLSPLISTASVGINQSQMKPDASAQEERKAVQQAYQDWTLAVQNAKGNPDGIVALYAANAILLPTLSPEIKINMKGEGSKELFDFTRTDLRNYFIDFSSKKGIHATTEKLYTQLFDDVAINTGLYTFSYQDKDGKTLNVPARFTFVYEKIGDKWMIINHHSSYLP